RKAQPRRSKPKQEKNSRACFSIFRDEIGLLDRKHDVTRSYPLRSLVRPRYDDHKLDRWLQKQAGTDGKGEFGRERAFVFCQRKSVRGSIGNEKGQRAGAAP